MRTTVEDLGRRRVACWGVPRGGAFDPVALAAANLLVGNSPDAAGLELTLKGPRLENTGEEALAIALVGADFEATIVAGSREEPVAPGSRSTLAPGQFLASRFARDGVRAWLAIEGGVDVPLVLGSRSTLTGADSGGLEGRPLRRGDLLTIGPAARDRGTIDDARAAAGARQWLDRHRTGARAGQTVLRILPGPQSDQFTSDVHEAIARTTWVVSPDSNRVGVRLGPLEGSAGVPRHAVAGIAPEGTTLGAIQATPDGMLIVLGPDRPTTGGYAKPALVIAADIGCVAALRPGDRVSLLPISLDEACRLAAIEHALLGRSAGASQ
jgi:antagonist of KipI